MDWFSNQGLYELQWTAVCLIGLPPMIMQGIQVKAIQLELSPDYEILML